MYVCVIGPGYQLVFYFGLYGDQRKKLKENPNKAIELANKYFNSHVTEENGQEGKDPINQRMKCINGILNLDDQEVMEHENLGGIFHSLIKKKNHTPFMTGPNCHRCYRGQNYFELDMDTHKYQFASVKLLGSMIDSVSVFKCAVNWVIQGNSDDELPEQSLASVAVNHCDWKNAVRFVDVYPKALTPGVKAKPN